MGHEALQIRPDSFPMHRPYDSPALDSRVRGNDGTRGATDGLSKVGGL